MSAEAAKATDYPNDIRPLTSLRIVAAVWVLLYHFRDHLGLDLGRFGMIAKGYLGVDLFFVLSGFILSHVYLARWEGRAFNYGSFLWARLSRVYPVHLVTLAATIGIWLAAMKLGAGFDPIAFDPAVLPQHLLLIHAWGTTPTVQWNFPSWSISAEWFAYLAFPLAAAGVLAFRRHRGVAVLAALGVFGLVFWLSGPLGREWSELTQLGALRIIPAFLLGVALYRMGATLSLSAGAAWGGVIAAVLWIATLATLKASDLFIWPAFGLLILCLAEVSKRAPRGLLGAAALVYLGEVSYAVYMTHLPVDIAWFNLADRIAPDPQGAIVWVIWGGVFAATLIVSVVTYHLVERPARNWLRRHDPFLRRPPAEPPHEPVI